MQLPDLALLPSLDALLREQSVTRAAEAMSVSVPAMSRTLGRLRRQLGDPLLVGAGRGLAPTPLAERIRPQVTEALATAVLALTRPAPLDLATLTRTVTIRTTGALTLALMPDLLVHGRAAIPGLSLRFVPEGDEDPTALRTHVDLDIGVLPPLPPDISSIHLSDEDMVAVVRRGHPLTRGRLTPKRFAATDHVMVSRRGRAFGPIDVRLAELGLSRPTPMVMASHAAAALIAAGSDLVALVPRSTARMLAGSLDLVLLAVPLDLPTIRIAMAWHGRLDDDPVAAWVRAEISRLIPG